MKKIFWIMILGLVIGSAYSHATLPNHKRITFTLSQIERGTHCPALLNNAKLVIEYEYNFEQNMGLAYVRALESVSWVEVLHPLGLSDYYAFMSDMAPKIIPLNEGDVTVYRVIFHLYTTGDSKVFMMAGTDGDCIMSSNTVNVFS